MCLPLILLFEGFIALWESASVLANDSDSRGEVVAVSLEHAWRTGLGFSPG